MLWVAVWVVGTRYGFQPCMVPSFTRINTLLGDPGQAHFTPGGEIQDLVSDLYIIQGL